MLPSEHSAVLSRAIVARDNLRTALAQSIDSDDPIIMDRVKQAEMLISAVADMLKAWEARA